MLGRKSCSLVLMTHTYISWEAVFSCPASTCGTRILHTTLPSAFDVLRRRCPPADGSRVEIGTTNDGPMLLFRQESSSIGSRRKRRSSSDGSMVTWRLPTLWHSGWQGSRARHPIRPVV